MALKYTAFHEVNGSKSFELRNCTASASCDMDSQLYSKRYNSYFLVKYTW